MAVDVVRLNVDINKLISILSRLADEGVSDVYAIDDEVGIAELRVVSYGDYEVTIEHTNCSTDGKIEE